MTDYPITCDRLRTVGLEEASGEGPNLLNLRSDLLSGHFPQYPWKQARAIAERRGWTDCLAELDANPPKRPEPVQRPQQEPDDPTETAYDAGAEARSNGISRCDNPHPDGDLAEAWDCGWVEAVD